MHYYAQRVEEVESVLDPTESRRGILGVADDIVPDSMATAL